MWNYNIPYKSINSINNLENNIKTNNIKRKTAQKNQTTNNLILLENLINKAVNFIKSNIYSFKRYLFLFIGIILLYKLIVPYNYEYRTLLLLIFIEFLAIMLSSISVFLFTHLNFINDNKKGNNNVKTTKEDKTALYILLGFIFLSVHLCIGFSILGIYITQITN